MNTDKKAVSFTTSNTYSTLNNLDPTTKTVWIVFHGIGYLSRYFIRLFEGFNKQENYFIAPQAPSKYYKDENYKKVGASWLTKENTKLDIDNVLQYIDAIVTKEKIPSTARLVVLGYSQGVSIASRWVASRKIECNAMVMISGGFPKELVKEDFSFFTKKNKAIYILGNQDPYFDPVIVEKEKIRVKKILPQIDFRSHPGGHELDVNTLTDIV